MSDYDYSGALALFDTTQAASNADYGGVGSGVSLDSITGYAGGITDYAGGTTGAVGDSDLNAWLAQNYPELLQDTTGQVNTFGQTADDSGGGIVNGLLKGWNALGNNGQLLAGSAALGGLQNYMQQRQKDKEFQRMGQMTEEQWQRQQRQKDEEFQRMGQMAEEQWQRQMLLKQAPTNKLANVDHFKSIVNSLRGSH